LNHNFIVKPAAMEALLKRITHRFVIYGCSMVPLRAELMPPPNDFKLRSVHVVDAGILLYERIGTSEMHYVKLT
jgi:hypothetical protein